MQGKAPRTGLIVVAMLLAASAAAQDSKLYRWVDKDGHVHYGDQPGGNASQINLHSINTSDSAANDSIKAAAVQKQTATCQQKSDQLTQYQKATSITETDALGNQHQYTPEEQSRLVANTQKYLDDNCSGSAAAPVKGPAEGSQP
jgi:hypothetical protein